MNKKINVIGIAVLTILFTSPFVLALGVTRPVPLEVKLMSGESQNFRFQIQAVTSVDDQECYCSLSGLDPLLVTFEKEKVKIDAGGVKYSYFTVEVPEDAPTDQYTGKLSVRCGAAMPGGLTGSMVYSTINSPFTLDVVTFREAEKPEMEIPKPEVPYENLAIIAVVAIILIAGVYYRSKKIKKGKKVKRAKKTKRTKKTKKAKRKKKRR